MTDPPGNLHLANPSHCGSISRPRSFARTHARNANASAIEIDFPVRGRSNDELTPPTSDLFIVFLYIFTLFTFLPFYLFTFSPFYFFTFLPFYSTFLPFYLSTFLRFYLSTFLPFYQYTYLSLYLSIHLCSAI